MPTLDIWMSHLNVNCPPWTNALGTWSPAGGTILEGCWTFRKWHFTGGSGLSEETLGFDSLASTSCIVLLPDHRHMWLSLCGFPALMYLLELQGNINFCALLCVRYLVCARRNMTDPSTFQCPLPSDSLLPSYEVPQVYSASEAALHWYPTLSTIQHTVRFWAFNYPPQSNLHFDSRYSIRPNVLT